MVTLLGTFFNRTILFSLLALSFCIPLQTFSQTNEVEDEILVYFLPDSLELPDGITELTEANKLKIKSKNLDNIFKKIELKSLKKAFPDFSLKDTVKVSDDGSKIKLPNMSRIFKLKLKKKDDVQTVINILSKEKSVLFAETHSDMKLQADELYPRQWHLNNSGQTGGTTDADIDAPEAWSIFTGSSSVKLGVIDSGVETSHDDLTGKSSGDLPESYPYGYGHGTHVAGIAAGKHSGGKIKGVDANVQVLSRKVFNGYQYNPYSGQDEPKWAGDDNAYNKIKDAVNSGANILNNSYGGSQYSTTLRFAFSYVYKMNRVSVVSIANSNTSTPYYPAAFGQGIVAVGSTDHNDNRSDFSNYGSHIDVSAPGSLVVSAWMGNAYDTVSGTSMAAPNVSGIATLLKGYNSNLYNDDIENIIRISADDKGDIGWDQYYGTGRGSSPYLCVNIFRGQAAN